MNYSLEFVQAVLTPGTLRSVPRIDYIAWRTKAATYLEIGVRKGATFLNVNPRYKVAVDPVIDFDWQNLNQPEWFCLPMESDTFFDALKNNKPPVHALCNAWPTKPVNFDIIFIDGLHTFEQSFRDFENSLAFAHEQTVWIIDDTVPTNAYSAIPDEEFSYAVKELAGISDKLWHGDVYKTVFAIHDKYPEYSYCTLMGFNPQTIIWKTPGKKRPPVFNGIEEIKTLDYYGLLKNAALMAPGQDTDFPAIFGTNVELERFKTKDIWKELIYTNLTTGALINP